MKRVIYLFIFIIIVDLKCIKELLNCFNIYVSTHVYSNMVSIISTFEEKMNIFGK